MSGKVEKEARRKEKYERVGVEIEDIIRHDGWITSQQVAELTGDYQGADGVMKCKVAGIPLVPIGFVPGSRQVKRYVLESEWL